MIKTALCLLAAFGAVVVSFPAEPLARYARFCSSCGVMGKDTISSHSKQFIIHGASGPVFQPLNANTNRVPLLAVDPQLIAVTAERIKRTFLEELNSPDFFRDKIHMLILDRARDDQPVTIVTKVFSDGFEYMVGIPPRLEHRKLAKAIVQVLLLEYCNRHGRRAAELPLWLVEGFTQQILSSVVPTYVVNRRPLTFEILGYDRLASARELLSTNACLTYHELSFPEIRTVERRRIYESCSHLLVHELFRLPEGAQKMGAFLAALPRTLNWQTAFYNAFAGTFGGPLDVEKWWALTWLEFKNQDDREAWPVPLSLHRLKSTLLTSMEFRMSSNSLPELRDVPLQQIVSGNDFPMQKEIIAQKLKQFYFLSFNMAPEVQPLMAEYQEVLDDYVEKRTALPVRPALRFDPEVRLESLVKTTLRQLDELDGKAAAFVVQPQ